ncbi:hypothetical protein [Mycoplasma elephantis]|uniref:hypothetical protein n=1 Tax=Mycoplasma elephantis TaxID=114882 RepID=UPI0004895ACE|nr:hypothetical protein [Mycoplasma elephantis]
MWIKNNKFAIFIQGILNSKFIKNRITRFLFFLIFGCFLFVSAIANNVYVLSVFHSYTFGMVFGYSSYIIYFIMIAYSIWLLVESKISIKKRFYYEFTSRVKFSTIILFILFVSLLIQLCFDISDRGVWFGHDNNLFLCTNEWYSKFSRTNNEWFPISNTPGLFWAILFDFICLTGSNITVLFIIIFILIYLLLVGIYKKPFTLLFNKDYKVFNKWLNNKKNVKTIKNKEKIQKKEKNIIKNEDEYNEEYSQEELQITKEILKTEIDINENFKHDEKPERSYTSTFSFTQEIANVQANDSEYSKEFELLNNPFWEKNKN